MKNLKITGIIGFLFQLIFSVVTVVFVIKLNVLPTFYIFWIRFYIDAASSDFGYFYHCAVSPPGDHRHGIRFPDEHYISRRLDQIPDPGDRTV